MTAAIVDALGEKLERLEHEPAWISRLAEIMAISARCSALVAWNSLRDRVYPEL